MATRQYLTNGVLRGQPFADVETEKLGSSYGFDCNICLDPVQDPVVTLCGHLYCWPCIYKWIRQQDQSPEPPTDHKPQCPVCKTEVSDQTLVPLYGRGQSKTASDPKTRHLGPVIPNRPKGLPCHQHPGPPQLADYPYDDGYDHEPTISLPGTTTFHPVISMFGEMICASAFGNSGSLYTYPNSYSMAAMSGARARRHASQADQSLSRMCFFLFCCLVLCLVLF